MINGTNPTSTETRKRFRYRYVICILAALFVLIAITAFTIRSRFYTPGKITFQEYAPTYLPAGIKVKQKSIESWYIPAGNPTRYTMLNIDAGNVYIYERKNDQSFTHSCSGTAENVTCTERLTPKGQQYLLTTANSGDANHSTQQQAEWLRGNTHILLNLSSKQKAGYPSDTIGRIIDSFKPVEYKNLPYHYYDKSSI